MADDVNGLLVNKLGETLHLQLDLKYNYVHNTHHFGNCISGYISKEDVAKGGWILLSNKSLIQWSK